jgi:hypothetical protein
MEIDREELIELMSEYWAISNNPECAKKSYDFCKKYDLHEVDCGFNQREYDEWMSE